MLNTRTRMWKVVLFVVFVSTAGPALAGPPLLCQPFETGTASLLPWGKQAVWNAPDSAYDVRRLTADTVRLLAGDAPILARMENLRRATIYAARDKAVAHELLATVLGRALASAAGINDSRAWFDAAYLVEAYRQASFIKQHMTGGDKGHWTIDGAPSGVDGYVLMTKAMSLAGPSPEMEFAASLMSEGGIAAGHRTRALAAAPRGSLVARNLSR